MQLKIIEMKPKNETEADLSQRIFLPNLIRMMTKFVYVNFWNRSAITN